MLPPSGVPGPCGRGVVTERCREAASRSRCPDGALDGLALRSIGPAVMGGRIDDVAVDESRPWVFYIGAASGGVWKTTNAGTTWTSLFDDSPCRRSVT